MEDKDDSDVGGSLAGWSNDAQRHDLAMSKRRRRALPSATGAE
jgi:hypothetical protein